MSVDFMTHWRVAQEIRYRSDGQLFSDDIMDVLYALHELDLLKDLTREEETRASGSQSLPHDAAPSSERQNAAGVEDPTASSGGCFDNCCGKECFKEGDSVATITEHGFERFGIIKGRWPKPPEFKVGDVVYIHSGRKDIVDDTDIGIIESVSALGRFNLITSKSTKWTGVLASSLEKL